MKLTGSFLKKGFSLIELSLTLVVISSLAVVAITKYAATEKIVREKRVYQDFYDIRNAINAYVSEYGYYPCPASSSLQRNDPNAGIGVRNQNVIISGTVIGQKGGCNLNYSSMSDTPAWSNVDIPNISTSYENVAVVNNVAPVGDIVPPATRASGSGRLVYGAVPCKELGLPMDCGLSPEGDRYEYVVSARLTTPQECQYYLTGLNPVAVPPTGVRGIPDPLRVLRPVTDGTGIPDDSFGTLTTVPYQVLSCQAPGILNSLANLTALDAYYTRYPQNGAGDYALIYFGSDGIGSYGDNAAGAGSIHIPNAIGGGAYSDDNKCQAMNHKALNVNSYGGVYDYYFLMPRAPFNPDIIFGDVVYYGKAANFIPTFCVYCKYCSAAWDNKVVKVLNTTATTPFDPADPAIYQPIGTTGALCSENTSYVDIAGGCHP